MSGWTGVTEDEYRIYGLPFEADKVSTAAHFGIGIAFSA
jgi:hypothetical protein